MLVKMPEVFTININFPALDSYVSYLEGGQQTKIDELTETVKQFTGSLATSTTDLTGAVDQNTKEK